MKLYKIAVFARPGAVTAKIRHTWRQGRCDLVEQSNPVRLRSLNLSDYAGALLDVRLDPTSLFDLSEDLVRKNVHHAFVFTEGSEDQLYSLSCKVEHVRSLLDELLYQNDDGERH